MSGAQPITFCPDCGTANPAVARFCQYCGRPLQGISTQPPPMSSPKSGQATTPPNPFKQFMGQYYAKQPDKAVERTKMGLSFLSIGFLISWAPAIAIIGGILELAGALLVISGRRAFGPTHARNVFWAIIITIVAFTSAAVLGAAIAFQAFSNPLYNPSSGPPSVTSSPVLFFIGTLAATAIFGIAEVLFTYALQSKNGKILLWFAYVSSVAASIGYLLISSSESLNLLPLIAPGLLFAVSYFLARRRIVHGEIPQPTGESRGMQ